MNLTWMELSASSNAGHTHLATSNWCYDKHPDCPEMDAHSIVTILDANGPGVITNIHVSNYLRKGSDLDWEEPAAAALVLRVWYDDESEPSIEMPFMDFLGDTQNANQYYHTVYFSKVQHSHNFRLPMPFKNHIRMELENPTDMDLVGYAEIQWQKVEAIPESCGYLYADYRAGNKNIPEQVIPLFQSETGGVIVAHWLQLEGDLPQCHNGEVLCEANHEFYLDGESKPSLEYLGTEDYYGYSWGFKNIQSDHYVAITRKDDLPQGGSRIGMLRCRTNDRISFSTSCRVIMDYSGEYFSSLSTNPRHKEYEKLSFEILYRSCYYYYQNRRK